MLRGQVKAIDQMLQLALKQRFNEIGTQVNTMHATANNLLSSLDGPDPWMRNFNFAACLGYKRLKKDNRSHVYDVINGSSANKDVSDCE